MTMADDGPPEDDFELPIGGFQGSPEEIERQWFEQVYKGRGDSMAQLTWRAVIMGSFLGCVLSLTNLYIGLKSGWGDGGPGVLDSFWVKLRCGVLSTTSGPRHPSKCRAAAEPRVHFVFCCAFRHSRPLGRILAPKFSFVLLSSIRVVHVPRKAVV